MEGVVQPTFMIICTQGISSSCTGIFIGGSTPEEIKARNDHKDHGHKKSKEDNIMKPATLEEILTFDIEP